MIKRAAGQRMEQVEHPLLLPDTTERRQPVLVNDLHRSSGIVLCHISRTAVNIFAHPNPYRKRRSAHPVNAALVGSQRPEPPAACRTDKIRAII
jgi:hypothetical protein